ncbi:glycosyltransferase family 2 protein [Chryseobacterium taihuense]|uniref:Glycosyltransferase involved in cell wall bisynthesis n=1 Tax=Chryseobacterium taihuense TaxID=1141221 RepID=A0ABY0QTN2_9FLAO|nr:glycosyltransferase family 2 protein [Chryseobacterium taihuense]SDL86048.1 Glycosyltransferase involved in cell wall bisynthesis [Chryseobacterium taihuense]
MNISVIIPVYNAEAFLEQAVNSALIFEEVKEILLIEDCSSDNSLRICHNLIKRDSRIKLYQHPDKLNHGAGASRNLGIEKATSEFIAFLDSDDYYLPNRFDAEKSIFKDPNIDGVFGGLGVEYLSEKGKSEFEEKFKNTTLTTVKYHAEGKEIFRGLLNLTSEFFGTFFHLNTLTIKKSAIHKSCLKFNTELRVHQDSDFITKLSYYCYLKSGIIDRAIAIRGVHDNNRITKIKMYSTEYNSKQLLLWRSLYIWSKNIHLNADEKKYLLLQYKAFELSTQKGLQKYINLASVVVKYPQILKTRYRFTYTKR